jgi:hypothetical protein
VQKLYSPCLPSSSERSEAIQTNHVTRRVPDSHFYPARSIKQGQKHKEIAFVQFFLNKSRTGTGVCFYYNECRFRSHSGHSLITFYYGIWRVFEKAVPSAPIFRNT